MVAFDEKINAYFIEANKTVNEIIRGSDEHLDIILSITKPLEQLAERMKILNEKLIAVLDSATSEVIQSQVLPEMNSLNRACFQMVGTIYRSQLYRDVRAL